MARRKPSRPKPGMYAPHPIVSSTNLDFIDKVVYAVLYAAQGRADDLQMDYTTLAALIGADRRAARTSLLTLIAKGLVTQIRQPSTRTPGLYRVDLVAVRNQRKMFAEMRERQNPKIHPLPKPQKRPATA